MNRSELTSCAALPQGGGSALTTVQVSTATPAHQNPIPPSTMDTSAKTALFTLRRSTPSSHSRHHRHLSWYSRPLTFCQSRHRRLSQVFTPETEVEETRPVRGCSAALFYVGFILPDASKAYASVMVVVSLQGVLRSICNACVHCSKRSLAPLLSLISVIFSSVLWLGSQARAATGPGKLGESAEPRSLLHIKYFSG